MLAVTTIHSDAIDTEDIIAELLAPGAGGDGSPVAGVLFASLDYDSAALVAAVNARHPGIALAGCTANGTLSHLDYHTDGVLLMLLSGDGVDFEIGVGRGLRADIAGAARAAATGAARRGERPALVLVFPDALAGDMVEVVDAIVGAYGPSPPPIFGGSAADDWRFTGTSQFARDQVLTDAVVVLACYGPLEVTSGVAAGWQPIGAPMTVTAADGAVVRRIDGRTPREILDQHFPGFGIHELLDHPLAVFPNPLDPKDFYLRALMRLGDDGSAVAYGSVPLNATVRLTIATSAQVLAAAVDSLDAALDGAAAPPELLLVISCAGRQTILGTECGVEQLGMRSRLAARGLPDVPMVGFYSYGEIGRIEGGSPRFHNETCVTVAVRSVPRAGGV
jgi:hypothetical protein